MTLFTLEFDMDLLISKADVLIKNILSSKDLGLGNPKKVKKNTTRFCDFLLDNGFLKEFKKSVGFDQTNTAAWIKKKHGTTLMNKIEENHLGFTQVWSDKKRKFIPKKIRRAVWRRIHYITNCLKDEFGMPRGKPTHTVWTTKSVIFGSSSSSSS